MITHFRCRCKANQGDFPTLLDVLHSRSRAFDSAINSSTMSKSQIAGAEEQLFPAISKCCGGVLLFNQCKLSPAEICRAGRVIAVLSDSKPVLLEAAVRVRTCPVHVHSITADYNVEKGKLVVLVHSVNGVEAERQRESHKTYASGVFFMLVRLTRTECVCRWHVVF